jgi:hypothetical protein
MDPKSYSRWYDYYRDRDAMFAASDTESGITPLAAARLLSTQRGNVRIGSDPIHSG